jgi:hypothetical protein
MGQVDGAHAAAAQQPHDLIAFLQHGIHTEQAHQLGVAESAEFAGVAIVSTAVGTHLGHDIHLLMDE